jgi:hypothetical protein
VPPVPAGSWIDQSFARNLGQSKDVIEFPKGKKARIRRDLGAVELELQPTVEMQSQRPGFAFTRRLGHLVSSNTDANTLILISESGRYVAKMRFHLGNRC